MPRILHIMLKVTDLDKSVDFYTNVLGMRVLRTRDRSDRTIAFVGYEDESEASCMDLVYFHDAKMRDIHPSFGHIAINIPKPIEFEEKIKNTDVEVTRGFNEDYTNKMKILDPDGYEIEVINKYI
jgi:lactoylglutathione lyase